MKKKIPKEWIPTIPADVDEEISRIQDVINGKSIGMANPQIFVSIGADGDVIFDVKDCDKDGIPI